MRTPVSFNDWFPHSSSLPCYLPFPLPSLSFFSSSFFPLSQLPTVYRVLLPFSRGKKGCRESEERKKGKAKSSPAFLSQFHSRHLSPNLLPPPPYNLPPVERKLPLEKQQQWQQQMASQGEGEDGKSDHQAWNNCHIHLLLQQTLLFLLFSCGENRKRRERKKGRGFAAERNGGKREREASSGLCS